MIPTSFIIEIFGLIFLIFAILIVSITMVKRDFDNLSKNLRGAVTGSGTDNQSVEMDFEIPRGMIIKIKKVEFQIRWAASVLTGADSFQDVDFALLRDPDDTLQTSIPDGEVQHDIICDGNYMHEEEITTEGLTNLSRSVSILKEFDQEEDVVSARNLRLNMDQGEASPDFKVSCVVYYTLERVSDIDIINLLDIL